MNDLEREAERLLALYAEVERPPPELDERMLAYLREETHRRDGRRQAIVWAVLIAAAILLWIFISPGLGSHDESDSGGAAVYGQAPGGTNGAAVQGARAGQPTVPSQPEPLPSPVRPPRATPKLPRATPEPADDDDPGVEALREARGLLRAGAFTRAFERLEPCARTVGTDDLQEDCEVLVIEALCRAGKLPEAQRRLDVLRGQSHGSAHIHFDRLSKICSQ